MLLVVSVPAAAEDGATAPGAARPAASTAAVPGLLALVRRIERVAAGPDGPAAADALHRARLAVTRVRAWLARGEVAAAKRSMRSAEAALALAQRQVALVRTKADQAAASAAAAQAERDADSARQAREQAQARLQRGAQ